MQANQTSARSKVVCGEGRQVFCECAEVRRRQNDDDSSNDVVSSSADCLQPPYVSAAQVSALIRRSQQAASVCTVVKQSERERREKERHSQTEREFDEFHTRNRVRSSEQMCMIFACRFSFPLLIPIAHSLGQARLEKP